MVQKSANRRGSYGVEKRYGTSRTSVFDQPLMCIAPVIFMVLLGAFEPEAITQMHPTLHKVFRLFYNTGCILGAVSIVKMRKVPASGLFVLALLASTVLSSLISPYSYGFSLIGTPLSYVKLLFLCVLLVYWMQECPKRFLRTSSAAFYALCLLNLVTEIAVPGGLYQAAYTHEACYLLGHKNSVLLGLLPGIVCVGLYDVMAKGKSAVLTYSYLCLTLANVILARSSTSSAAVLICMIALFMFTRIDRGAGPGSVVVTGCTVSVAIVFVRVQDYIANVIAMLFNKSATFSGRTTIWDGFISLVRHNPLTGVGLTGSTVSRSLTGGVNAHNMLLGILVTGGFFRLAIYAAYVAHASKTVKNHLSDGGVKVLCASLACFAVVGLMETLDATWPLFSVCALFDGYCLTALRSRPEERKELGQARRPCRRR